MIRDRLGQNLVSIHEALRQPEEFALRWHREGRPYSWGVFAALALTAIAGTTIYGLILGISGGPREMFRCGGAFTLAVGIAWGLPLPALYILNSLTGSRERRDKMIPGSCRLHARCLGAREVRTSEASGT